MAIPSTRKPANIAYGVDETPPLSVTALTVFQQFGLMSINLIYPVLIGREVGGAPRLVGDLVSLSCLTLGVGALLQALPRIGSGFLCQPVPSAVYLIPSLLAARRGGLPLVFGMTACAGLIEIVLSRTLRKLRPLFPPEIAGLVVALIGLTTGAVALRTTLGVGASTPPGMLDTVVAVATLGTMVALNVWSRGMPRLSCVLIGMIVGYGVTVVGGGFRYADWETLAATPWVMLPRADHVGWAFDASLVIPFSVAAIAAALKVMGNVTTCQKLNNADWVRADMRSISRGVLADGVTTTLAGALGTSGVNSGSAAVGLASATGILSRQIAYGLAGLLVFLAFFPKLGALFFLMPSAVAGPALLFAATFMFVNGLEIMTSRLLDPRRTFVIGLSVMCGLAVDFLPGAFARFPAWVKPLLVSSVVLGPVMALLLNGIFRLGVRKTQTMVVEPTRVDQAAIEVFMETSGAGWGARRDVIDRASFNLSQSIEVIVESCDPRGPLEIEAAFDEFNLDLRVSYMGPPLELPQKRPSNDEIMESEEGQRRLGGYMLRRHADRVQATHRAGRSTILFHFDH
jgi:NCS2 family nucleobase:cation symporter-2